MKMPEPSDLEIIAVTLGVCGTIGTIGLAATAGVSALMINTLELYADRKRKYEFGKETLQEKPSLYQAFCDAWKFERAYVLSFGSTNNTNWDFDNCCRIEKP